MNVQSKRNILTLGYRDQEYIENHNKRAGISVVGATGQVSWKVSDRGDSAILID